MGTIELLELLFLLGHQDKLSQTMDISQKKKYWVFVLPISRTEVAMNPLCRIVSFHQSAKDLRETPEPRPTWFLLAPTFTIWLARSNKTRNLVCSSWNQRWSNTKRFGKSTQIGMKDMKLVQYSLKDIMCCNIIRIKVIFCWKGTDFANLRTFSKTQIRSIQYLGVKLWGQRGKNSSTRISTFSGSSQTGSKMLERVN